jgi:hypothetical protein
MIGLSHAARLVVALGLLLLSAAPVQAKRAVAKSVDPVLIGAVRYSASSETTRMGFVIATDAKSGKELWRQRIYRIFINPFVEADVQWVFIKSLAQQGRTLIITNEREARFRLDLATREVTKVK